MEDGPPIENPQEMIKAIRDRPDRWICTHGIRAISKVYDIDIAIVSATEGGGYRVREWFRQKKKNNEPMMLLLSKKHYKLLKK